MIKLNIIIFIVLLAFSANALKSHSGLRNKQSQTIMPSGFTVNGPCLVPKLTGTWICSKLQKTGCCSEWSSAQCLSAIDPATGTCQFEVLIECSISKNPVKGLECESS